jgi:hypothetical protein
MLLIYDTVICKNRAVQNYVDTSRGVRCRTSEELNAYGRLTVAADKNCGLSRDYSVHDLTLTVSYVPKLG